MALTDDEGHDALMDAARERTRSHVPHLDGRQVLINAGVMATPLRRTADGFEPWRAYGQSKLANLLFTFELQRRLWDLSGQLTAVAFDTLRVLAN